MEEALSDHTPLKLSFPHCPTRIQYEKILKSFISFIKQQSMFNWINFGDTWSSFFFIKIKQRKMTKYIYSLNDNDGHSVEDFNKVASIIVQFYWILLRQQIISRNPINLESLSNANTRTAIFSIPNTKSQGPNEYPSEFCKAAWKEIGPMYGRNNGTTIQGQTLVDTRRKSAWLWKSINRDVKAQGDGDGRLPNKENTLYQQGGVGFGVSAGRLSESQERTEKETDGKSRAMHMGGENAQSL
ncbi:hypothetical protein Cgig2_003534 [Carnegiea gigantea]|uniref:Uncharacterized protein n=1 Tax=Carnegiea gigantea TaxID=171969 RepID=A0A9Q1GI16_9CARY|nr:hypothetical protein Cgig2_003534 [Carnegiea gigantea]